MHLFRKASLLGATLLLLAACQPETGGRSDVSTSAASATDSTQYVLQQAFEAHGSRLFDTATITFRFRQFDFRAVRQSDRYQYERAFLDTTTGDSIRDILTNNGLVREINGQAADIPEERRQAYSRSVNSVIYFALLPYNLSDPAVQAEYLGQSTIKEVAYHKLMVTFQQKGGGRDFEDEFVYWFRTDNFHLDYLAYNYLTDGGGARFRVAKNARVVAGIRFQDYDNLEPIDSTERNVRQFDRLYEQDSLNVLSQIITESVTVQSTADFR